MGPTDFTDGYKLISENQCYQWAVKKENIINNIKQKYHEISYSTKL